MNLSSRDLSVPNFADYFDLNQTTNCGYLKLIIILSFTFAWVKCLLFFYDGFKKPENYIYLDAGHKIREHNLQRCLY